MEIQSLEGVKKGRRRETNLFLEKFGQFCYGAAVGQRAIGQQEQIVEFLENLG